MLAGTVDLFQTAPACLRQDTFAVGQQQLREAEHRIQRRAQFMAHARQELRLGQAFALRHGLFLAAICALRMSVTSQLTPMRRVGRPCSSRTAVEREAIQRHCPSGQRTRNSRFDSRPSAVARSSSRHGRLAVLGVHQCHALVHVQRHARGTSPRSRHICSSQ